MPVNHDKLRVAAIGIFNAQSNANGKFEKDIFDGEFGVNNGQFQAAQYKVKYVGNLQADGTAVIEKYEGYTLTQIAGTLREAEENMTQRGRGVDDVISIKREGFVDGDRQDDVKAQLVDYFSKIENIEAVIYSRRPQYVNDMDLEAADLAIDAYLAADGDKENLKGLVKQLAKQALSYDGRDNQKAKDLLKKLIGDEVGASIFEDGNMPDKDANPEMFKLFGEVYAEKYSEMLDADGVVDNGLKVSGKSLEAFYNATKSEDNKFSININGQDYPYKIVKYEQGGVQLFKMVVGEGIELQPWQAGYALNHLAKEKYAPALALSIFLRGPIASGNNNELIEACVEMGALEDRDVTKDFQDAVEGGCNVNVCKMFIGKGADVLANTTHGGRVNNIVKDGENKAEVSRFLARKIFTQEHGTKFSLDQSNEMLSSYFDTLGGTDAKNPTFELGSNTYQITKEAGGFNIVELGVGGAQINLNPSQFEAVMASFGTQTLPGADNPVIFERAQARDVKFVQVCLDAGMSPNLRGGNPEQTLLHFAAASGNENLCKALVNAGADVVALDRQGGKTALSAARDMGDAGNNVASFLERESEKKRGSLKPDAETRDRLLDLFYDKAGGDGPSKVFNGEDGSYRITKDDKGDFFVELIGTVGAVAVGDAVPDVKLYGAGINNALGDLGRVAVRDWAVRGEVDNLREYLDIGFSLGDRDSNGDTLLRHAAHNGQADVCELLFKSKLLFKSNIDALAENDYGYTAMRYATDPEVYAILNEHHEKLCKYRYDELAPNDKNRNEILGVFYQMSDRKVGGQPTADHEFIDSNDTLYRIKEDGGNYTVVGFNAEGAEVKLEDWQVGYAINSFARKTAAREMGSNSQFTTKEERLAFTKACVAVGVGANDLHFNQSRDDQQSLLHLAARNGDIETCTLLLDQGADISKKTGRGSSALHLAAAAGHEDICQLLVARGADVLAQDNKGLTPLGLIDAGAEHNALIFGVLSEKMDERKGSFVDPIGGDRIKENELLVPFVGLELEHDGVKYEVRDLSHADDDIEHHDYALCEINDGPRVADLAYLMHNFAKAQLNNASLNGDADLIKACIAFKAPLNEKDKDGNTPLHNAIAHKEASELLIRNGADISALNANGRTAFAEAKLKGNPEVIKLFEDELKKKHSVINEGKRNKALEVFLANNPGQDNRSVDLECPNGQYFIKKDGANFKLHEFRKNSVGALEWVELTDEWQVSAALRDIGSQQIFAAAQKGNEALYRASVDVGASAKAVDARGNTPLTYAKAAGHRDIANLALGRQKDPATKKTKDPKDKFRELAILVRDKHLAGGTDAEIQASIELFGKENPDFKIGGLKATDMTVFMEHISLKQDALSREVGGFNPKESRPLDQHFNYLMRGKNAGGEDDQENGESTRVFYRGLLTTCLENGHSFISDEHNDGIGSVIAQGVKHAVEKANGRDIGYSALNAFNKNSIIGQYQQVRFREIQEREGLSPKLTYEEFTRNLGEVIKVNYKLDRDQAAGDLASREEKLLELRQEVVDAKLAADEKLFEAAAQAAIQKAEHDRVILTEDGIDLLKQDELGAIAKAKVEARDLTPAEAGLAVTREEAESKRREELEKISAKKEADFLKQQKVVRDKEAKVESAAKALAEARDSNSQDKRAVNALFGSGSQSDLQIAVNMMRSGQEFTQGSIHKAIELEQQQAAKAIQKMQRGFGSRRKFDLDEFHSAQDAVKEMRSWKLGDSVDAAEIISSSDPKDAKKFKKFKEDYYVNNGQNVQIQEVQGKDVFVTGEGVAIHMFEGANGLHEFSEQVDSVKREYAKDSIPEVSIARISNMPRGGCVARDSYCIATSGHVGTTKTFTADLFDINEQAEEAYKKSVKRVTDLAAAEGMLNVLVEARGNILPGSLRENYSLDLKQEDDVVVEGVEFRKDISEQVEKLRFCIAALNPNEKDTLEEKEKKQEEFTKRWEALQKDSNYTGLSDRLTYIIDANTRLPMIDPKNLDMISNLTAGKATQEQKDQARQETARQISRDIGSRVQASVRDNQYKFNLDDGEVKEAVDKYQGISGRAASSIRAGLGFSDEKKAGFEKLLKAEMPDSPYPGISVLRPRGMDKGHLGGTIATVIFNGDKGDDSMNLSIPGSPNCYMRVSRCDSDKDVLVYRDGKQVKESHKKGDVIIDTGVVFHKDEKGVYTAIPLDEIENKTPPGLGAALGAKTKMAAQDFRIKAVSINEGKRCGAAMLYNGHSVSMDLQQKTSPIQEVDVKEASSAKGAKKQGASNVILNHDADGNVIQENINICLGGGKNVKFNGAGDTLNQFAEVLSAMNDAAGDRKKFLDDVEQNFGKTFAKEVSDLLFSVDPDDVTKAAKKLCAKAQEEAKELNQKFAVIHGEEGVSLAVAIDPVTNINELDNAKGGADKVNFTSPEIQILNKTTGKTERFGIFNDPEGTEINDVTKAKLQSLGSNALASLVAKILPKDQAMSLDLNDDKQYEQFCQKVKVYCNQARVGIGKQEMKVEGTVYGKPNYKPAKEMEVATVVSDQKLKPDGTPNKPTSEVLSEAVNRMAANANDLASRAASNIREAVDGGRGG